MTKIAKINAIEIPIPPVKAVFLECIFLILGISTRFNLYEIFAHINNIKKLLIGK